MATKLHTQGVVWGTDSTGIAIPTTFASSPPDMYRNLDIAGIKTLNQNNTILKRIFEGCAQFESADQPEFRIEQDTNISSFTTCKAVYNGSATTMVFLSTNIIKGTRILNNRTGEEYSVTDVSVSSGESSCTVVRAFNGVAGAATQVGDKCTLMSVDLPERGDAGEAIGTLSDFTYNYISVMSASVSATSLQQLSDMRNSIGQTAHDYTKVYNWMQELFNNSLAFGTRKIQDVSKGRIYMTGGFNTLVQNTITLDTTPSLAEVRAQFLPFWQNSSSSPRKLLVGGTDVVAALISVGNSATTVSPVKFDPVLFANITTIDLGNGMIVDVVQDMHTFKDRSTEFFLIDPAHVGVKPYNGMETLVSRDVSRKESHIYKEEIFGSTALALRFPDDHIHATGKVNVT